MDARIMMQAAGRTQSLSFEVHRTVPGEAPESGPIEGEHSVVVFLEGSVEMTVRRRHGEETVRAVPGSTSFLAGDAPASMRVTGSAEVAALSLSPQWFQRVDRPEATAAALRSLTLRA